MLLQEPNVLYKRLQKEPKMLPIPFAETRAYVPKVAGVWQVARLLCITPPESISDGCVFATMQP